MSSDPPYNNFSESLALPHESYVAVLLETECSKINCLPLDERCAFARQTSDCRDEQRLIDYASFIYCGFGEPQYEWTETLAKALLVVFCCYLFFAMAIVADKLWVSAFLKNLKMTEVKIWSFSGGLAALARLLNLSENLAGVTLLSIGNCAPDIFAAIVDPDHDSEIFVTEQLGCTVFMTTIVAGIIIILKPFQIIGRNFIRDALFLVIAVAYVEYSILDGYYQLEESIVTISMYLIYLALVIVMHLHFKRVMSMERLKAQMQMTTIDVGCLASSVINRTGTFSHLRPDLQAKIDKVNQTFELKMTSGPVQPRSFRFFAELKESFSYLSGWHKKRWFKKLFNLLFAPTHAILMVVIPSYDFTLARNGWNKPLNLVNLFTLPLVFCTKILSKFQVFISFILSFFLSFSLSFLNSHFLSFSRRITVSLSSHRATQRVTHF